MNAWLIAVIVALVCLSVAGFIFFLLRFKKRKKEEKSPVVIERRGKYAEDKFFDFLNEHIQGQDKLILKDLILPGPLIDKDNTTEIDALLISKKGIVVFEVKSWNGVVYGDDEVRQWKVVFADETKTFYSPIDQNQNHCYRVLDLLRENDVTKKKFPIYNFVVFYDADISNVKSDFCFSMDDNLIKAIDELPDRLTPDKLNKAKRLFQDYKNHPPCSKEEHIRHVRHLVDINGDWDE